MAFKMAKGSLFAVLLRNNWWYSIAIGSFVLVASLMITDAQYVLLSITGALPFFGIGSYAAYKQLQQPSKKRVQQLTELVQTMSAAVIAEKIAANYNKYGYESAIFKADGADLELIRDNRKLLLSTKRFKAANTGISPLKLLVAAGEKADARGYLYVSLGEITDSAHQYAKEHNIELIEAKKLAALIDGKAKID
jgi:restriction system protein